MKIFLAAAESYCKESIKSGYKNLFTTFYIEKKAIELINLADGNRNITVDSGAHSFLSQRLKNAASSIKAAVSAKTDNRNLDNYVDKYCEFIKKYKDKVNYFVELDIDVLIGMEKLLEIRKKLYDVAGKQLIVCYHSTMGAWKENRDELFKYDYIALQGIPPGGKPELNYMEVLMDCYNNKKKVHIFAMTKKKFLSNYPVYSTDSTSWQSLLRFGKSTIKLRKGLMKDFYSYSMRSKNVNFQRFITEETKEWEKLGDYLTRLWKIRGIDWESRVKYE